MDQYREKDLCASAHSSLSTLFSTVIRNEHRVRRIGKSKDSDLCANAHRCPHYAYVRLCFRNYQFTAGMH